MPTRSPISLLNVAENGQVTIPATFRKEHALSKGGKLIAVSLGDSLVMIPHDGILEAICLRFEEALRDAGSSVAEVKAEALVERARIVSERYGHLLKQSKAQRAK